MADVFANLEALIKEAGLMMPEISAAAPAPAPAPAEAAATAVTVAPVPTVAAPAPAKKKFMLVGTHAHQTTGYSKVTYHIVKELAKCANIEVYHFGFQKFMKQSEEYRPYPTGVDVFDPAAEEMAVDGVPKEMGFGFSQLPDYVRRVQPDVIMIYNDAGVICRFLDKLAEAFPTPTYKMLIYIDQVYKIQRPEMLARIEKAADAYFAFTPYWKSVLEAQGVKKPVYVLRHGFDATQFVPKDRSEMRKKHGIPEHLTVFLNLNRNTPRKRHDIVATAFAELVARNPTRPLALMCVCDGGETGGFPLQEIYLRELEKRNVPLEPHVHKLMLAKSSLTYTDTLINELYALSDVGVTAADGEGFGLCHFEAMGVGIPQVVPYIGGFRDYCVDGENSRAVPAKWSAYLPLSQSSVGGYIEVTDPLDLAQAMEDYAMDTTLREKHGAAARKTVLKYVWAEEVKKLADVIDVISAF
jgi:glycosyltransferase involved in cell wall biosynthesis